MDLRFYLDSATAQPHIYKHDVDEEEVEEVLTNAGAVRLLDRTIHTAEVHWYEAHGIGRKEFKLKLPLLD